MSHYSCGAITNVNRFNNIYCISQTSMSHTASYSIKGSFIIHTVDWKDMLDSCKQIKEHLGIVSGGKLFLNITSELIEDTDKCIDKIKLEEDYANCNKQIDRLNRIIENLYKIHEMIATAKLQNPQLQELKLTFKTIDDKCFDLCIIDFTTCKVKRDGEIIN